MEALSARARNGLVAICFGSLLLIGPTAAEEADLETGTRLAEFLRAGRSVLSNYQTLINDPAIGNKHLDGERFTSEAMAFYAKRNGHELIFDDLPERDQRLLKAQVEAMREVVDEQQQDLNRIGIGFKGFVPAVFARLMNEKFASKVGEEALVRVTAPQDLVRNRKSLPDVWEGEVIEKILSDPARPKDDVFTEVTEVNGRPAFRMLLPEYYTQSCLSCHGEPKGEIDVTGYPKEGGRAGDLGGAISIVLFK